MNDLPRVATRKRAGRESNLGPVGRNPDARTTTLPSHIRVGHIGPTCKTGLVVDGSL